MHIMKATTTHHISDRLLSLNEVLLTAVKKFGTPLYVYDLQTFNEAITSLKKSLPSSAQLYYSLKANPNPFLISHVVSHGLGIEVCSKGELLQAFQCGAESKQILLVGPGKSKELLSLAVRKNIELIALESLREFQRLQKVVHEEGVTSKALLRINLSSCRGAALSMAGSVQFGMDEQAILNIIDIARKETSIRIVGLHGYFGTGILAASNIIQNTRKILEIATRLQEKSGLSCLVIDVGGGFGIPYFENDCELDLVELSIGLREVTEQYLNKFPNQKIIFESGRFLAGTCGVFLTSVLDIKSTNGYQYVIVDGGTNCMDLGSQYFGVRSLPLQVLNPKLVQPRDLTTICGPLCTPTDRLASNIAIPPVSEGDVIAIYHTGAYGLTAARLLFLSQTTPSEVVLDNDQLYLVKPRLANV